MGNEQNNSDEEKKFLSKHQKRLIKHQESKIDRVQESIESKPNKKGGGKLRYLILLLIVIGGWYIFSQGNSSGRNAIATPVVTRPLVGDHWHANYSVYLCAEKQSDLPESINLGIHTHGDGLVHIHPGKQDETGANANMGRFFDSTAQKFSETEIYSKKNGAVCANTGKAGSVKLSVNGKDNTQLGNSVPQDGDAIEIRFE